MDRQRTPPADWGRNLTGVLDALPQAWAVVRDLRLLATGLRFASLFGWRSPRAALREPDLTARLAKADHARLSSGAGQPDGAHAATPPTPLRCQAYRIDGSPFVLDIDPHPVRWDGQPAMVWLVEPAGAATAGLSGAPAAGPRQDGPFWELAEGSIQGILVHRDFKPLFANQAYAAMYGYDNPAQVLALPSLAGFVTPERRDEVVAYYYARMAGRPAPETYECDVLRRDGSRMRIDNRVRVVDWDGAPAVQITSVDISAREWARSDRQESEARFRNLFESTFDGVVIFRLDGTILEANAAFAQLVGHPLEELVGGSILSVVPPGEHDAARAAIRRNRRLRQEARAMRRGGAVFPVEMLGTPYAYGGAPARLVALRDIGERHRLQARMAERERRQQVLAALGRFALQGTDHLGLFRSTVQRMTEVVPADAAAVLEADPGHESVRCVARWGEWQPPARLYRLMKDGLTQYVLQRERPVVVEDAARERRFRLPPVMTDAGMRAVLAVALRTGGHRPALLTVCSRRPHAFDADARQFLQSVGDLLAVALMRRAAEQERESLLAELGRANEELQDIAYTVSHDLKAPLRAINALADWIAQDNAPALDAEGQENLALLQNRTRQMARLLDGILRYSHVGRITPRPRWLDSRRTVGEVLESLELPPHLAVRIAGDLPRIRYDPAQFTQVVQNLVGNAMQHGGSGTGSVDVSCRNLADGWEFCVCDDGIGIDPKHGTRIFRLFQGLKARDETDSTGVGLAIVKKIVELNGGRVWVESAPGAGAAFKFTVPRVLPTAAGRLAGGP